MKQNFCFGEMKINATKYKINIREKNVSNNAQKELCTQVKKCYA